MNRKKAVKVKSTKPMNKPTRPVDKQRGVGVVELLIAASTLCTTVLVAAMSPPKQPPAQGD
jgi:hypothetical protein